MKTEKASFTLYKIYSENCLLYLGRTKQPLNRRLHAHFFKTPMVREINIDIVTRIEFATFATEADMNLMEIYFINKLKPILNRDDKAKDELTITLPDIPFQEFHCSLMEKWKDEIHALDTEREKRRRLREQLEAEKNAKRKEIFQQENVSDEQKQEQWWTWLEQNYEPIRNEFF